MDSLVIAEVRLIPVLVADPPLLNTLGVHQPYTPRLIIEVTTEGGPPASARRTATPSTSTWRARWPPHSSAARSRI